METTKKMIDMDDKIKTHFDFLIVSDRGDFFGAALLREEAEVMKKTLENLWHLEEIQLEIVEINNNRENFL